MTPRACAFACAALSAACFIGLSSAPRAAVAQVPEIDGVIGLGLGERLVIPLKSGFSSAALGDPSVINVDRYGRGITVVGLKLGYSSVEFQLSRGETKTFVFRVVPESPRALIVEVNSVLGERSGVIARDVNGLIVLEGEVASANYQARVKRLAELYPNQVMDFTSYRESYVEEAKMVAVEIDFVQLGLTNRDQLGVRWGQFLGGNATVGFGDTPLYYSATAGGGQGGGGGQGAGAIGPGILPGETNPARLPTPATLAGGSALNPYFNVVGNLNFALDLLVENGLIKTRQHGIMITEAGTEGEYRTGGRLLVRASSLAAAEVREIPFGLKLKVKPIVDSMNRVKLEISAEYSELDASSGVGELPGLRDTVFKGVVNMAAGQSALISGITSSQVTNLQSGWAGLGQLPLIGWLFKSRNYLEQRLDNALFVTPRLYEPGGAVHNDLVTGVFETMQESGFDPEELPEQSSPTPPPPEPLADTSDDVFAE